jgi:DNA-directed RNA polymerase specialized sigma24 family protein
MARWSASDPTADRRLVEGLREGNETALTTLYDTYAARLYDYCLSVVGESPVAQDIVHDVLIDACRRAPRMRDRLQLRPWLYGAARRRCLQRSRLGGLRWNWTGESDARTSSSAGSDGDDSAVPPEDVRELLDATLSRLDFVDQEALLLTLRHDLTGSDLAATWGLSGRQAGIRRSRARSRAQSALAAELQTLAQRCDEAQRRTKRAREVAEAAAELAGHAAFEPGEQADTTLAGHIATCPACRGRAQLTMTPLLDRAPAPVPPATLRRRVLHTGIDPELGGYRADIAGRGGTLTPDGLPRQPDVLAPPARRLAFLGGGMVGALVTALLAGLIIGPLLGHSHLYWSFRPRLEPSTTLTPRTSGGRPSAPLVEGQKPPAPIGPRPTPGPASPRPPDGVPAPAGRLGIATTSIWFKSSDRVAYVDLSAALGPVNWSAAVSTTRLSISEEQGTIPAGGSVRLTVVLDRAQVELPGTATITVSSAGEPQRIEVSWAGSILT